MLRKGRDKNEKTEKLKETENTTWKILEISKKLTIQDT